MIGGHAGRSGAANWCAGCAKRRERCETLDECIPRCIVVDRGADGRQAQPGALGSDRGRAAARGGEPVTVVVPGADVGSRGDGARRGRRGRSGRCSTSPQLAAYTPDGYTSRRSRVRARRRRPRSCCCRTRIRPATSRRRSPRASIARSSPTARRSRATARRRVRAADVPGQAGGGRASAGRGAAPRHHSDRRVRADQRGTRRGRRRPYDRDGGRSIRRAIRQKPEPPFQEAKQAVDLSQAERIVAVGRGIKGQEHLALAEKLAAALGAELAASRPICDAGWLPMERQIGSSGQTVAPKLYVALGISGAIQHVVGHEGRAHDRRHQQGRRRPDLRDRRLRHRRRSVRDCCPR